ncbi:hypothetical protein EVG20_g9111 [Dentipellis fragilis]|uniref:Chromatin target of PRMT1 protein C-terminal domain-containing protein n=1 Tax=Dentipellis fragilis TaxID=205917 RepID=A0A4Y9Y0U2_9AGAM|nr:hypothetical protein EVG20_g9111 [Dentipellis fragilis]
MAPFNRRKQAAPAGADGAWLHDKAAFGTSRTAPAAATTEPTAANSKLVVSNLHYEITPKDLMAIFGQIGTLVRQPMDIAFDNTPLPRQPRHSAPGSLINRIQKAPLIERLGRAEGEAKASLVKATRGAAVTRGRGRGRGARSGGGTKREKSKPKTAEDLDKELDAFIRDGDVEMQ